MLIKNNNKRGQRLNVLVQYTEVDKKTESMASLLTVVSDIIEACIVVY